MQTSLKNSEIYRAPLNIELTSKLLKFSENHIWVTNHTELMKRNTGNNEPLGRKWKYSSQCSFNSWPIL